MLKLIIILYISTCTYFLKNAINWNNGLYTYSNSKFQNDFMNYNIYRSGIGFTCIKNCGISVGAFYCTKNIQSSRQSCLWNNTIFRLINTHLKNWNNEQAKKIYYNYLQNNNFDNFNYCVLDDIAVRLKIFYNNYKKINCETKGFNTYDKLPLEIKTSMVAISDRAPIILHSDQNLKKNINYNFLTCNFKELSNNIRFISSKMTYYKIFFNNIADLVNSIVNKKINENIKKRKIFLIIDYNNLNQNFYNKIKEFLNSFINEIYNEKLEIGLLNFKNNSYFISELKHYNKDFIWNNIQNFNTQIINTNFNISYYLDKVIQLLNENNSKNDLIPSNIFLFSNNYLDKKNSDIQNKIKKIENNGFLLNFIKLKKFNSDELKDFQVSLGLFVSLDNQNLMNSEFLTILKNKSNEIIKNVYLNNEKNSINLISNQKIPENSEIIYKINLHQNKTLEFELKNDNDLKNNDRNIKLMGTINYRNPNCFYYNVFKNINKNDNKVYFKFDFLKNYKNYNYDKCSSNIYELKKYPINDYQKNNYSSFQNFLNQMKLFRPFHTTGCTSDSNITSDYMLIPNYNFYKKNEYYDIYIKIENKVETKIGINMNTLENDEFDNNKIKELNKERNIILKKSKEINEEFKKLKKDKSNVEPKAEVEDKSIIEPNKEVEEKSNVPEVEDKSDVEPNKVVEENSNVSEVEDKSDVEPNKVVEEKSNVSEVKDKSDVEPNKIVVEKSNVSEVEDKSDVEPNKVVEEKSNVSEVKDKSVVEPNKEVEENSNVSEVEDKSIIEPNKEVEEKSNVPEVEDKSDVEPNKIVEEKSNVSEVEDKSDVEPNKVVEEKSNVSEVKDKSVVEPNKVVEEKSNVPEVEDKSVVEPNKEVEEKSNVPEVEDKSDVEPNKEVEEKSNVPEVEDKSDVEPNKVVEENSNVSEVEDKSIIEPNKIVEEKSNVSEVEDKSDVEPNKVVEEKSNVSEVKDKSVVEPNKVVEEKSNVPEVEDKSVVEPNKEVEDKSIVEPNKEVVEKSNVSEAEDKSIVEPNKEVVKKSNVSETEDKSINEPNKEVVKKSNVSETEDKSINEPKSILEDKSSKIDLFNNENLKEKTSDNNKWKNEEIKVNYVKEDNNNNDIHTLKRKITILFN